MKNSNLYQHISLLCVLFLSISCGKSFLDRGPQDALTPASFWKSQKDFDIALTGLYNDFEKGPNILYRDCGSDNSFNNAVSIDAWSPLGNGSLSSSRPGHSYYHFHTIIRCNEFLEAAAQFDFAGKAIYEAQARFLRAYRYYVLTTNYGDIPLFTGTFTTPEDAQVPRTPKEEVQAFIESELKEIIPVLPDSYSDVDYGKATKGAAQALLTRFYLYYGKYEQVLETAGAISGYALYPSFAGLFEPQNEQNEEVLFSIQHTPALYTMNLTLYFPASIGGWSSISPTQELVNTFEMADGTTIQEAQAAGNYDPTNPYKNRDPRLRGTVIYPGARFHENKVYRSIEMDDADYYSKADHSSKTGYNYRKYANAVNASTLLTDISSDIYIFRYAEILLSIAEAKVELNQIDETLYDAIDQVRQRAGQPETDRSKYKTQGALRALVRRERRVEFAGEGLRRDDIMRWKIAPEVMNIKLTGVRKGKVLETTQANGDYDVQLTSDGNSIETRVFSDKNYLLPIPQTAMDKNMALTQNDGY